MKLKKSALAAFWILLAFNLWHNSIRGLWNFSVRDSLNMNGNVMPLAQSIDPAIREYKPYDGAFYYAMAVDPLLITKRGLPFVDVPPYRYKRLLYPLTAYMLAAGHLKWLPYTLLFINIACWFFIGWIAWRLAESRNLPRVPLVIAAMTTTGLTFSIFRTMTEPMGFAFAFLGCYWWDAGRRDASIVAFALAGLAREVMVFIPLNILFYEIVFRRQSVKSVAKLLWSFVPLALWTLYLQWRLPPMPEYTNLRWLQVPVLGFFRVAMEAFQTCTTSMDLKRTLSLSIAVVVLTIALAIGFIRSRSLWGWLALSQALFCYMVSGYAIWNYHAGSSRVIIPLMIFSSVYFLMLARKDQASPSALQ